MIDRQPSGARLPTPDVDGREVVVPPTFLRFDRPELEGDALVVRVIPESVRARRRASPAVPLGYRYDVRITHEPESDVVVTAGHYDEEHLVWSFSGELDGIAGLTYSYPSNQLGPTDKEEL